MSIIQGTAHTSASGHNIERSLRFNSADSAYLSRTPASAGNRKTYTISFWLKRGSISSRQFIFGNADASALNGIYCGFQTDIGSGGNGDSFIFAEYGTILYTYYLHTTQLFRDPSAWYHIVIAVDTSQATNTNRIKIYVNGSQVTVFSESAYPTQNLDTAWNSTQACGIGRIGQYNSLYLNAYLTEFYNIDGQALTPSSFGETDPNTGVWKPKAYTGTYGTNGFYLKFADNSGTTSTTLGKDSSGNGNNWTPNNFSVTAGAGNDSLVDTPTPYGSDTGAGGEVRGNYATLNPIRNSSSGITFSNGNLDAIVGGNATYRTASATIILPSSGLWYWEATPSAVTGNPLVGIGDITQADSVWNSDTTVNSNFWYFSGSSGNKVNGNGGGTAYGSSVTGGTVIGVAFDANTGKIWFRGSSTWYASGDPVAGTNAAFSSGLTGKLLSPAFFGGSASSGGTTWSINFGQRPFAYTAPSGFKALCTTNLPTPTIGATSTTQANDYFDTILWTGDDVNPRNITGLQFQPDLVWAKARVTVSGTNRDNQLFDAVRGADKALSSNLASAEDPASGYSNDGAVTAFLSNGFTVGGSGTLPAVNWNGATYVAWNWKANGAGSTNTAGTITSTVSANTTAGFSIVTYTGNGTAGATVGHGLGVAPQFMFFKRRSSADDWPVYHVSTGATNRTFLSASSASGADSTYFNNTEPTSTVFSIGTNTRINANTSTYVAYCFAPVAGYSAFGSYTGNGSTDGPFVYLGFRPRYLLIKQTSSAGDWNIIDTARDTYNLSIYGFEANTANAENSLRAVDILANGFKLRGAGMNTNSGTFIYAAFAESPFKYSLAR